MLLVCAVAAVVMVDLLSATIILGVYSLLMAVVWTRLNAVDVAFTEASVGAGITTMLILAVLSRTRRGEGDRRRVVRAQKRKFGLRQLLLLLVAGITCAILVYGTMDMPDFGDPAAPANHHVANRYIEKSHDEVGMENFVTAILASYRGYDTFGETTVIFTAGVSVIMLLRRKRKR